MGRTKGYVWILTEIMTDRTTDNIFLRQAGQILLSHESEKQGFKGQLEGIEYASAEIYKVRA
jgi:hypothetical protein